MGKSLSPTYLVETGVETVVVKVSENSTALSRSEHNLQVLASLGIPVPRVLAYDGSLSVAPLAILVMTHLRGRDLHYELDSMSRTQMTTLAEHIVEFQRRAATLPVLGKGCGFAGIGVPVSRTWSDVVRHPNGILYANPLPADAAPLVMRLEQVLNAAESTLDSIEPICFLDDLTTKNVLIENGYLSGVVDFDHVAYGDPLFHPGLTGAAVRTNASRESWFYIDELIRLADLSERQLRMRDLYEAVFLINFLGAEWPHKEGPWRSVASQAADDCLSSAESHFGIHP
jgi:aminoglycoside phosphotransferase (APT) family kinase protein